MLDKSVLFFSKKTEVCYQAALFLKKRFRFVRHITGDWGDPFPFDDPIIAFGANTPHTVYTSHFDFIISFLCPWIFPKWLLDRAKVQAVNFHPAPPKYPGIGGYNYAIWNEDKEYGVMVHEMAEKVDTGKILNVWLFAMNENDTVESLKERSMVHLYELFKSCVVQIEEYDKIVDFGAWEWTCEPKTRADFQRAIEIHFGHHVPSISTLEYFKHKIKAFYYHGARDLPYIDLEELGKYKLVKMEEGKS